MTEERVTGKVLEFKPRQGFGFIVPEGKSESDKVFVHWESIKTDERWPALKTDMEVEFAVEKVKGRKQAKDVSLPGGENIDYVAADEGKNYKDGGEKFQGKVKFYDIGKGFGMVIPNEEIEFDGKKADKDKALYMAREDIIIDRDPPALDDGAEVEFQIYSNEKGLGAGRVTGPEGAALEFKGTGQKRRKNWGNNSGGGWNKKQRNNNSIEVGLHIMQKDVGTIIGEKGETVKEIRRESGCNRVQFGQDRVGYGDKARRVLSIQGDKHSVVQACLAVSQKITESADFDDARLSFLIPNEYCGMFIGKGGSFLKDVESKGVKCDVENNPIMLPGASMVSRAYCKGDTDSMEEAIGLIVGKLGSISKRVTEEAQMMSMQMGMGGGYGGGRRYGGGQRWGGGRGRGRRRRW